jgi:hypothetical protein
MVHFQGRFFCHRPADHFGRNAGNDGMSRNVVQYDASGADYCTFTDLHVSQYLGTRSDQDTPPHLRMAIACFPTGAAERNFMKHRYVILDNCGFPNDNAGRVVDKNAFADLCRGVYVHSK